MNKSFGFSIKQADKKSLARAGVMHTPHGDIHTPTFTVAATKATTKSLTPEQITTAGAESVLANTYHLYLQPGSGVIKKAGGLHKFMNWPGPIYTDSGGFQVFSLGEALDKGISKLAKGGIVVADRATKNTNVKPAKITGEGVTFYSHIDGSKRYLDAEKSMQIQHDLGADIIFAFDECTSPAANHEYQKEAMDRTHAWARRSLDEHKKLSKSSKNYQALFGIVQGGRHKDLRRESARTLAKMDFDGYGIGGSFSKVDMGQAVRWVNDILPENKPRHLLGIGEPADIFAGIESGVDSFDCVNPTRLARTGTIYTHGGRKHVANARFATELDPLEPDCACYTCQNFSSAYLSHLVRSQEMLAATLLTIHNLNFMTKMMSDIHQAILEDKFDEHRKQFLKQYNK
ncbi:tRNA guanosine(34) transglycosylase Tgt [Candidatus Saccharibacteria bacterium]|nr:tRNA guanosine(34) transglycosylase Tgt [Candidatus Saccharibacteria bacterium]